MTDWQTAFSHVSFFLHFSQNIIVTFLCSPTFQNKVNVYVCGGQQTCQTDKHHYSWILPNLKNILIPSKGIDDRKKYVPHLSVIPTNKLPISAKAIIIEQIRIGHITKYSFIHNSSNLPNPISDHLIADYCRTNIIYRKPLYFKNKFLLGSFFIWKCS